MEHVQNSVKRPISTNWKPIQWLSEAFRVPSIPSWWDWLPRGWGKRSQAETSYFFHVSWNRGDSQILICKRLLGQGMPRDIICKGRQGGGAATTLALPPADGHLEGHGGHRAMEPISDMGHVAKSWMIWIDMVGKNSLPDLARSCKNVWIVLNCLIWIAMIAVCFIWRHFGKVIVQKDHRISSVEIVTVNVPLNSNSKLCSFRPISLSLQRASMCNHFFPSWARATGRKACYALSNAFCVRWPFASDKT